MPRHTRAARQASKAVTQANRMIERLIGAASLDAKVYEEIEADKKANGEAAFVVVGSSFAAAAGGVAEGLEGAMAFGIGALIAWAIYAWLAYVIGAKLLNEPETRADWGEVLRVLGYASAPRFALVLAIFTPVAPLVSGLVGLWVIAATVVALRAALDFSTGRAFITAIAASFAQGVVVAVLYASRAG